MVLQKALQQFGPAKGLSQFGPAKGLCTPRSWVVDFSARSWCKRKAGASCPNTLSLTLW